MFGNNNGNNDSTDNDNNSNADAKKKNMVNRVHSFFSFGAVEEEPELQPDPVPADPFTVTRWSLGDHSTVSNSEIEDEINALGNVNPELKEILQSASNLTKNASISGFECPVCGLNHGHSDRKHDVRNEFKVTDEFASQMDGCPYCHCGVNYLAMLIDFFGYIVEPMFTDQHKFEAVFELENADLQAVMVEKMQRDNSPEVEDKSMEAAVKEAGYSDEVVAEMVPELDAFYNRYRNIKRAAERAPIGSDVQTDIESQRDVTEEAIAELEAEEAIENELEAEATALLEEMEDDTVAREKVGEVVSYNTVGSYGFVDYEAGALYFNGTEYESEHIPTEGTRVTFNIKRSDSDGSLLAVDVVPVADEGGDEDGLVGLFD